MKKATSLKLKYTLKEANDKIVKLAQQFPFTARAQYMADTAMPHTTLLRYLTGAVPSPVAANHLAEYMEQYVKENTIAA